MQAVSSPLNTTSLAGEIARRVQEAILAGEIRLGEHLTQDALCARFRVSRTPVREALAIMATSSLIELRPHRGAVVRIPTRREVSEVYELRAELEGFAADRAARAITGHQLERADEWQSRLDELIRCGRPPAVLSDEHRRFVASVGEANDTFHDIVLNAADHHLLDAEARRLRGRFPKDHVTDAIDDPADLIALNVDEHRALLSALRSSDGVSARRIMREHIRHAGDLLLAHLDDQRFWP